MSDLDLGLGRVFSRGGAESAANSVDPAAVQAAVEQHDFRAGAMPKTKYPAPPPPMFYPQQPATLFGGPMPAAPSLPFERREAELRQYAVDLGKHEADRGFAWGVATTREQYDQAVRKAELDRDLANQRAQFAAVHPPTATAALGQAVVPWVPSLLGDPLIRLCLLGGVVYLFWCLGQRLLPKSMRGE